MESKNKKIKKGASIDNGEILVVGGMPNGIVKKVKKEDSKQKKS
jgi:hypothetical protein